MKKYYLAFVIPLLITTLLGETITVSGTVLDKNNHPISGVNIYSGTAGVVSQADGSFILDIEESSIIIFSHIGYRPLELKPDKEFMIVILTKTVLVNDEVIITSNRVRIGYSPITASNLSRSDLRNSNNMKDFPAVLSQLPSISSYSEGGTGLGYSYLSIRGFEQRKISVLIDGIPQNDPEDHNVYWVNFYDIMGSLEDVQVQRGIGAVQYGPPSIGGAINLITKQQTDTSYVQINLGYGDFNTYKGSLEYNTGIFLNHLNTFLRFSYTETDGYRNWSWANFKRYFLTTSYNNKNHKVLLHLYGGPQKDALTYSGLPKEFQTDKELRKLNDSDGKGIEEFNQPHFDISHIWKISAKITLNTTLIYLTGEGYFDFDGSWASLEYLRLGENNLESQYSYNELIEAFEWNSDWYAFSQKGNIAEQSIIRANVTKSQFGILQNLNYSGVKWNLRFGYELRNASSYYWNRLQESAEILSSISGNNGRKFIEFDSGKDMASIFTQGNYTINHLTFLGGLQIALNTYKIKNEKYRDNEFEYTYAPFINPTLGVNWKITPSTFMYTQFAMTKREPQITSLYDAADMVGLGYWPAIQPKFDTTSTGELDFSTPLIYPEEVYNIEIGFGTAKNNILIQSNIYYMYFSKELFVGELLYGYAPNYDNLDESVHYGLETQAVYHLSPTLQLTSNLSYNKSQILLYDKETELVGNEIGGFPDIILNSSIQYKLKDIIINGRLKYTGTQYTSNVNTDDFSVDPYLNINIGMYYEAYGILPGLKLNFYINNLTNDLHATYGSGDSFFMNVPRHYNLDISYRF